MKKEITIYNDVKANVTPGMTGLFFEDINYAADGGLYAEMIENREFEFLKVSGKKGDYYAEHDGLYGWNCCELGEMKIVTGSPVAEENPHYLRFTAKEAGAGFTNKAYDGVFLKKGASAILSFYGRNVGRFDKVTAAFLCDGQVKCETEIVLQKQEPKALCPWIKYSVKMTATEDIKKALPMIMLPAAGVMEFDFVSLIPEDAVEGIFRKDLFELLKGIQPGFIRFPGGCIIEGNTLYNRYRFKDTLKPLENRKANFNRWAVHGNDWDPADGSSHETSIYNRYNQTYGIGYYEYFLLCEKLGAKPLPVLNVGLACQYQSYELVEIEDPRFNEYVQDALDLIAFANEPATGKWGQVRASLGHPEPFNLEMVGIGNEQWETDKVRFFERYKIFEKTIHETYPAIKLIGSAGPDITSEKYTMAWDFLRSNSKDRDDFVYAVDEHYYVRPQWLLDHVNFYDNYDRKIKVFAGEYAAHPEGSGTFNNYKANTLEGALAEAAFLTGVERNADVVVLASYAPLFARINYTQWSPDMIWFDAENAYGTPSYYVQLMYSRYTGSEVLDTKGQHEALYSDGIYYNPTRDAKTGKYYVKVVNTREEEVTLCLKDEAGNAKKASEIVILGGKEKTAFNSIENMDNVKVSSCTEVGEEINLAPNSFNVIVF